MCGSRLKEHNPSIKQYIISEVSCVLTLNFPFGSGKALLKENLYTNNWGGMRILCSYLDMA